MKRETKLLHDMAAELEQAFFSVGPGDYVIEIPIKDARRLLRRYENWRKCRPSKTPLKP